MTQLALDLPAITQPDYAPELSLAERFALFHESNPHVADALEALSGSVVRGRQRADRGQGVVRAPALGGRRSDDG